MIDGAFLTPISSASAKVSRKDTLFISVCFLRAIIRSISVFRIRSARQRPFFPLRNFRAAGEGRRGSCLRSGSGAFRPDSGLADGRRVGTPDKNNLFCPPCKIFTPLFAGQTVRPSDRQTARPPDRRRRVVCGSGLRSNERCVWRTDSAIRICGAGGPEGYFCLSARSFSSRSSEEMEE